jgi:hypothetical protein
MSEAATESTATSAQGQETTTATETQGAATEDTTDWKAEARKWEARAKENSGAAKAAEKARLDAMSESERAVAEAEARGRTAAATDYGKRLARTEFDAIAGRRNPDFDTAAALEFVDLARFLGDDGEPDSKAIKAAVERLVPEVAGGPPSFDGGTRTATKGTDFNQELRRAAGRA